MKKFASRKSGLRFCLNILIWFLPALLGVDPIGTFVWCDGVRLTPFYAMFQGWHCLGYPLGLVGNYVKPRTPGTLWYPLPLTTFPQPPQPLPFTYESVPPGITDLIGSIFVWTPGSVRTPYWILQPPPPQKKPIQHGAEI